MAVDIGADKYLFKANGSKIKFAGFMTLYVEGNDENLEEKDVILPPLEEKEELKLNELLPEQHFTEPPTRYTEASLVKALEEKGIGRPSTYAPTITTIFSPSVYSTISLNACSDCFCNSLEKNKSAQV